MCPSRNFQPFGWSWKTWHDAVVVLISGRYSPRATSVSFPLTGSTSSSLAATCAVGLGDSRSATIVGEPISVKPAAGAGALRYVAAPTWSAPLAVAHAPPPLIGSNA